jgi:hypothetical protein
MSLLGFSARLLGSGTTVSTFVSLEPSLIFFVSERHYPTAGNPLVIDDVSVVAVAVVVVFVSQSSQRSMLPSLKGGGKMKIRATAMFDNQSATRLHR